MSRWWWWQKHPPACTCVRCNERRLRSINERPNRPNRPNPSYGRQSPGPRLPLILVAVIAGAAAGAALVYYYQQQDSNSETAAAPLTDVATPTVAALPLRPPSSATSGVPASATSSSALVTSSPLGSTLPAVQTGQQEHMPRKVFEEFESSFYGGCTEPPFELLRVARSWSGTGSENLRFIPPDGTYFLVLVGSPNGQNWRFDSTKESSSGKKYQSVRSGSGNLNRGISGIAA